MGLKEWAERNKAGGAAQMQRQEAASAKAAERQGKVDAFRAARSQERQELAEDQRGARAARKAAKGETFEGVTLRAGQVTYKGQGGPVAGVTARVESAADVRRRVTATRVLAVGVFALAARKQAGHVFLTVEGPAFEFVVEVPVRKEQEARAFAARVNSAAKRA